MNKEEKEKKNERKRQRKKDNLIRFTSKSIERR